MKVEKLMSRDVVTVSPDAPVSAAARLLSRYNVGAVPVCEADGKLRGVVTDRDIVLRCVAAQRPPEQTPVRDVMTKRVCTVKPGADASQAAALMAREQVRRLPVTEDGRVVGVLSLGDLSVNRTMQMEASACLTEISGNLQRR